MTEDEFWGKPKAEFAAIEEPDPRRRVGRLAITEAVLAEIMGLPRGHTIKAIHYDSELGLVQIDIEGDDMPEMTEPPIPVHLIFRRQSRVTAHWQHKPDKTWSVRE